MAPTRPGPIGRLLIGLGVAGVGAAVILMAYDYLPHGEMYAPRWVGAAAGVTFLASGLYIFAAAVRELTSGVSTDEPPLGLAVLMVTVILTCMALALGGVALFGDPRGMSGGLTGTAIEGRIVFGLVSLVVGALAAVFWLVLIARALSAVSSRQQEPKP